MNRLESPFGRKLLLAGLAPLLALSCILLAIDVITLHYSQRTTHQNTFELAQRLLTQAEPLAGSPIDEKKFSLIADILLSDAQILGLSLVDQQNNIIYQAGVAAPPQPKHTSAEIAAHPSPASGNWVIKIPESNKTWTLVLDDERFQLALYQNALIHLVILGTALAILLLLYARFKSKFFGPIRSLTHYLLSLKLTPHNSVPDPSELTYLHDCALLINEVIEGLSRSHDELRKSYEAALSDFKESLESVEIQNIEMDLARKSAIQAERVKSEFLIHASSDLLEPLRQCISVIQQLARSSTDSEQSDYIHNLETSLRGIVGLAQDIVDFSRLENGKLQLEVKNVQIRQVAHDALTLYAPMASTNNSRILSIVQTDVLDILLGDPRRLQQVLGNLINKVLTHGKRGNIAIKAGVHKADAGIQVIKFSVVDCNGGFDGQFVAQFKNILEGKKSEPSHAQGTSLGLSIARNLVDKMGGEMGIDLESTDQPCIWFTARLQIPENRLQKTSQVTPLKGCGVLVIDEQPASRLEMTTLLHSLGAHFLEVTLMDDLSAHMSRWMEFKPQIAIVDILDKTNQFDKITTLQTIATCNERLGIACVVVASATLVGSLQKELDPINACVISRPLLPGKLHQAITHLLSITPILNAVNSTPKIIPKIAAQNCHRILVVDDTPSNSKLIAEFLKPCPIDVITCESGAKALALCREKRFDLILMDIQMPDADGFSVTAKIRELELGEKRTPIVALTGQSSADNKIKYIVGGMDDYLAKPVSYDELIQIIGKWLGKSCITITSPAKSAAQTHEVVKTEPGSVQIAAVKTESGPSLQQVVVVQECLRLAKDNPVLARDMLQMLIDSLIQDPIDLTYLVGTHNWPELQQFAHKLYGAACYSGVPALKDAAQELDRDLQKGELVQLETKVAAVQREIQRLISWADDYDLDALFELA